MNFYNFFFGTNEPKPIEEQPLVVRSFTAVDYEKKVDHLIKCFKDHVYIDCGKELNNYDYTNDVKRIKCDRLHDTLVKMINETEYHKNFVTRAEVSRITTETTNDKNAPFSYQIFLDFQYNHL